MATTNWALDASHSEIGFKVKHLMISTVTGHFEKFDASVQTEGEDFATAKVTFSADIDSINTKNEQRDEHLKSAEFFDAANFPQLTFESTGMQKVSDEKYKLNGNLTLHGTTHAVSLDAEFGGFMKDPWGNERAGFEVSGKINRKDFGLVWHAVTETGGIVVSDEVKLHAAVEFIKSAN
ncbi:YceI family protein [Chitinophagaceae bacterium MMS25-I14]